ncbi:F-box domain-containing protein [Pseudohyphozyma bogoriensis]|nr:F-box domain-containing protein [Pseudohyphozyma bogoriensis]
MSGPRRLPRTRPFPGRDWPKPEPIPPPRAPVVKEFRLNEMPYISWPVFFSYFAVVTFIELSYKAGQWVYYGRPATLMELDRLIEGPPPPPPPPPILRGIPWDPNFGGCELPTELHEKIIGHAFNEASPSNLETRQLVSRLREVCRTYREIVDERLEEIVTINNLYTARHPTDTKRPPNPLYDFGQRHDYVAHLTINHTTWGEQLNSFAAEELPVFFPNLKTVDFLTENQPRDPRLPRNDLMWDTDLNWWLEMFPLLESVSILPGVLCHLHPLGTVFQTQPSPSSPVPLVRYIQSLTVTRSEPLTVLTHAWLQSSSHVIEELYLPSGLELSEYQKIMNDFDRAPSYPNLRRLSVGMSSLYKTRSSALQLWNTLRLDSVATRERVAELELRMEDPKLQMEDVVDLMDRFVDRIRAGGFSDLKRLAVRFPFWEKHQQSPMELGLVGGDLNGLLEEFVLEELPGYWRGDKFPEP